MQTVSDFFGCHVFSEAVMKQKPVTIVYPNSFAARHFRYIAEELLGNEGDAPMHKKGIRSYFKNVFSRKM